MGQMDEVMSKKVTSDAAAYIRSKAERRGRNVEMAEKAVVESKSFTEKEALELKLIDLVADDVGDLAAPSSTAARSSASTGPRYGWPSPEQRTVPVRMDWRQLVLSTIARPETLFLLLLGALAGLGTEISHPGLLFPGILGLSVFDPVPVCRPDHSHQRGGRAADPACGRPLRGGGQGRLLRSLDRGRDASPWSWGR